MMGRPSLECFIDDMPAAQASLARLRLGSVASFAGVTTDGEREERRCGRG